MVSSEVNELITKARRYLELAKISFENYCEACFLSALASELYLKGVSVALTGSFPTVHDLRVNTGDDRIDHFVKENRSKLKVLSDEYLYNLGISYDKEDAENCLNIAVEVISFAEGLLHKSS